MKINFTKCSALLLASLMVCHMIPMSVNAQENTTCCYPTQAQIQEYKEDGTWEKRQEYAEKLNNNTPSQELLYRAIQREYGLVTYTAGEDIPDDWKGMQVTGDAKMLLVRVEFADVKFEDSKIYSDEEFYEMVMGNGDTANFPYESLSAYYKRSSYNKLNISADRVYSCTLSENRDAYEWEDFGEQALIKEVMEQLDDMVDFSDYDANNDGQLDGICINFAGENTGWGSTWWSHKYKFLDSSITFDGVTPGGYIFLETYTNDDSYGTQTLIHETGHLLGLPDYYSQNSEGIGTTDMMNNNCGDHNGFSKWLLGWIEEENILRINRDSGDKEVVLAPLSCESPEDNKLIAVVAPEDTSIYSEYFIVQYDEYMGNQSIFELESPAYRVYHVNAQLNDEGTGFKYDNIYAYEQPLIRSVSVVEGENDAKRYFYRDGDALTPDTNEPSAFFGGDIFGFTGIEITDFKIGDAPSFQVSFREKEVVDGKLEFEIMEDAPLNMAALTLISNKPLIDAQSYQEAYLEDSEGNQYPLTMFFEDGSQKIEVSYLFIADSLKPETEYTLVIPVGMFQIDRDVYSEECRLTVKTGVFPQVVADYKYGPENTSGLFSLDDTKSGFVQMVDYTDEAWLAELHVFEGTQEVRVTEVHIPIPESYTEVMNVKGVSLSDGSIALAIRSGDPIDYSTINSFYKMDQSGNILAGPFSTMEDLEIIPVGRMLKGMVKDGGAVGAPHLESEYKLEIHTIDFENEITSRLIDMHKYMSKVYALDEKSYVVIQDSEEGYSAGIFNNKDEQIGYIDLSAYINGIVCTAIKADDNLLIVHTAYSESDKNEVIVSEFDIDGTHLATYEILQYKNWKSYDNWKMEETSWGYSLYNYTSEQPYIIYFLNDDFELISSMEVPGNLCDATHMGFRCIVKWYDVTTWGYRVAITQQIAVEDSVPTQPTPKPEPIPQPEPTPELTPQPAEPSGNKTENITSPNTGAVSHPEMLFPVMIILGGIVVGCLKRYRLSVRS